MEITPQKSYNLNLYNLEAMFASHEIHRSPKAENEFRVVLIGDSATWGFLLPPDETSAALLNRDDHILPDGRQLKVYNLRVPGYVSHKRLADLIESYGI